MLRNVEIKARIHDVEKIISLVSQMSCNKGQEILQHDVFYNSANGRLKLRWFPDASATLVYYDRSDSGGPKLSQYKLCNLSAEQANEMNDILTRSFGVKGRVNKKRLLFMVGQTRVHVDSVEGLGNFMELEVVLRPEQTLEEGQEIARKLQAQLEVPDEDLLTGAYMDLILKS